MVALESLGAGLLRDLEGVSTDAVSQSDLAFHALREYVPGDDLRHVHWRSSAKVMAAAGETQLLVRQYLDTRRSHATVVVDDDAGALGRTRTTSRPPCRWRPPWPSGPSSTTSTPRSCAATRPPRAAAATWPWTPICRARFGRTGLVPTVHRAAVVAPDTSLLFLISGPGAPFTTCSGRVRPSAPRSAGSC